MSNSDDGRASSGPSAPLVLAGMALAAFVANACVSVDHGEIESYVGTVLLHAAVYAAAIWWLLAHGPRRGDLLLILAVAVLLRGLAMTALPNLSSDAYRYVWDGRIQAASVNPYLYVPADEKLARFRDGAIYPHINRKEEAHTVYPPAAQAIFLAAVKLWDGLAGMKLVMLAFEALIVWALLGWLKADRLPRERVLIYAWHPLPIWEFASQAHIDAAAAALAVLAILMSARQRQVAAGIALAAATLVKFYPALLAPALWKRGDWRMPLAFAATIALAYLPYAWDAGTRVIGFLGGLAGSEGYSAGWGFHIVWALRDFSIADPPAWAYIALSALVLAGLAIWSLFARAADALHADRLLLLAAAFTFFTSPHYPWYFGWLVVLLARAPNAGILAMTLGAASLYLPRTDGGWGWTHIYAITYWAPFVIWLLLSRLTAWMRSLRTAARIPPSGSGP